MGKEKSNVDMDKFGCDWPVSRPIGDLKEDEKNAIEKTKEYWKISTDLYSDSTKWKECKMTEFIQIHSTYCEQLKLTIFKVKCAMDVPWERALDVLLDYPGTPSWNETCETCDLVLNLPNDTCDILDTANKDCFAWVAYMRMSDLVSRMISKRDFCTCFLMEKDASGALYVGTACDVSPCPPLKKCVRGEQTILAVKVEKTGENSCTMTQMTSINFKGMLFQGLVDLSMVKGLSQYAECLREKVKSEPTEQDKINKEKYPEKFPGLKS